MVIQLIQEVRMPAKYEVVPHVYFKRDDGRTASIHGALPWHTEAERGRWRTVEEGFTVYNPLTNQYGTGREPFATEEAAQRYCDTYRPSNIGIGD
jgi:hypothetical protein